jgi:23S rRNA (cytidine1920-2'-O)/16S rRNA (cytidine1409-2'-O)-methyltransferase
MGGQRLDTALVERGLARSRTQAARLIAERRVRIAGATARKPATPVDDATDVAVDPGDDWASRGAHKLIGALDAFGVDVTGRRAVDAGASHGGFTDVLLAHGVRGVAGIDVGHGQLHPKLRDDPRVVAIEKVNARELQASQVGGPFDLVTGDLSFISLTLVLPALAPLLAPGGHLLMLAKPQFELQPGQVGKGGVVRDAALYPQVGQRLRTCCEGLGLQVAGWHDSPIAGGDGNREFFLHARTRSQ